MSDSISPTGRATDASELLALAELVDIVFYECSGRRSPGGEESPLSIQIALGREELGLEVRCRATISGAGGEYIADASAVFAFQEPIEATEEAITDFAARVGVMAVYPYLRESITQSSAKLGLERPVLRLLRPGETRLTANSPDQG
ncbi:hypothetical protein [Nocardia salmonicida]|uniref:hypothetical protein n=1 Tax=Nocardia salmonicida TaxID=53431 RepID=UPI002E2C61C2|nr:hypothetical protein [Nocardia salmonicida]